jgi:hypothetical protein
VASATLKVFVEVCERNRHVFDQSRIRRRKNEEPVGFQYPVNLPQSSLYVEQVFQNLGRPDHIEAIGRKAELFLQRSDADPRRRTRWAARRPAERDKSIA